MSVSLRSLKAVVKRLAKQATKADLALAGAALSVRQGTSHAFFFSTFHAWFSVLEAGHGC